MRNDLDRVFKANRCSQYANNIGIPANSPEQLIINLRSVFKYIQNAGRKTATSNCHFGTKLVDFFGEKSHKME